MLDFPRWKVLSIFGVLLALMALAIPSFFPESQTKSWPVHPRINLGLDLAGGFRLFPFGTAFLQSLARGGLTGGRQLLRFGLSLVRRLRKRIGGERRQRRHRQTGRNEGGEYCFGYRLGYCLRHESYHCSSAGAGIPACNL